MFEQAERTIGFLSDLSPEALIGALLLALVIALTTAGTYRCLTGRPPAGLLLLVCLVLVANLASILTAVGYVQSIVPTVRLVERGGWPPRDRSINLYDHIAQPDAPSERGGFSARHR